LVFKKAFSKTLQTTKKMMLRLLAAAAAAVVLRAHPALGLFQDQAGLKFASQVWRGR